MLLKIKDAAGFEQVVVVKGQESISNKSSDIVATSVSQLVMAANPLRSGFFVQNNGSNNMWVSELGDATEGQPSIKIAPGGIFSSDAFPLTTAAINIIGTELDDYSAREW